MLIKSSILYMIYAKLIFIDVEGNLEKNYMDFLIFTGNHGTTRNS